MGTYWHVLGYGFLVVFGHVQVHRFGRICTYFRAYICSQWHVSGTFRYVSGTYNGTYLARYWVRRLQSGSYPNNPIPPLVHALFDPALLQVCSLLLHPVPASARRFLRVIYCFSSRPLRHHGRQRAAPQQQSSSRPLRRRRCSLRRLSRPRGRLGLLRRLSDRGHRRCPAAESAPS